MRKVNYLLAACMAVGLVAAGCGSSDDKSSSTTALTKQEFIKQADAVCAKGDKEIDKAASEQFSKGQKPSTQEQETFITDTAIPNVQNQIDDIRALTPPSGDEDQVNALLDAVQQALDKVKQDPSLLTDQSDGNDPFAEATKLTKQYGLKEC